MKRLPASAPARAWKRVVPMFVVLCGVVGVLFSINTAAGLSTDVVISQVYGGGGNAGAFYKRDFIELFNRGTGPVDLGTWSVQYASSSGTSWQKTDLPTFILQPGQYFLIGEASGTAGTADLPTVDVSGSIPMAAGAFKVALVNNQTVLSGANPIGTIGVVDFIGVNANAAEGTATAALSNSTSASRIAGGCVETDDNSYDFSVGAVTPRNSATATHTCPPDPFVALTTPANGATGVIRTSAITVKFSTNVDVSGDWIKVNCTLTGERFASNGLTVSGGFKQFTVTPDVPYSADGEECMLDIDNTLVQTQGGSPVQMADPYSAFYTTAPDYCLMSYIPIYTIQGSGGTASLGNYMTRGIVTADFEGELWMQGFYMQEPDADTDPLTSEGILAFYGDTSDLVNVGDDVIVIGEVVEYFGETQIEVDQVVVCGTGTVPAAVEVTLPVPAAVDGIDYLERYEGMIVSISQQLTVTEVYQLGRYNAVMLATGRLWQPTHLHLPSLIEATNLVTDNLRSQILLDDGKLQQNPDPVTFARGGSPLSANNTLRGGDTVTGILGVLGYNWGGTGDGTNSSRWRVRTTASPNFQPSNPRPEPVARTTDLRVTGMNLLNFFNSTAGCKGGVSGASMDCRGAENATELERQTDKTIAALLGANADVIAVSEIENDGYDPDSTLQTLVNELNAVEGPGVWAFVNPDTNNGIDSLGTDAIKVGVIYKPSVVTPVGTTAVLNSVEFVTGGDVELIGTGATNSNRNRPALAQSFRENATQAVFTVVANHLKSKGSQCDADLLAPPGNQGNCNAVRTNAANLLMDWLLNDDPTEVGDADVLILGDLNSYAKEDPIRVITDDNGYIDLAYFEAGANAYSYVFDGRWGYLDYSLASPSLASQVSHATTWHINADEPIVLDYNTNFKSPGQVTSFYAPDEFRSSDHDPVLVDLVLTPITYTLATNVIGNGDISVASGTVFDYGTVVTVTATPAANWHFAGWSGDCIVEDNQCIVTMDAAKSVTATFQINSYTLTVAKVGTGSGTVTSNPPGSSFAHGTVVTLTATADTGSTFMGWWFPCHEGIAPCVVTITGPTAITATFDLNVYALATATNGTGTGTVSINPSGSSFAHGTVVTVTATADAGSTFAGWSGACTGMGACVVTMDAAKSVTATFNLLPATPETFALTVAKTGNGSGLVTSTPAGIECGSDCLENFESGANVALTATADEGSTFTGWSGACTGIGDCVVTMDGAKAVTANFTLDAALPEPVVIATVEVQPGTPISLTVGAEEGLEEGQSIQLQVAAGTFALPTTLNFGIFESPFPSGGFRLGGLIFSIVAIQDGQAVHGITLDPPIRLVIDFRAEDVEGLLQELLTLGYYDETSGKWLVDGISVVSLDLEARRLIVDISHLTVFALLDPSTSVLLPLISAE